MSHHRARFTARGRWEVARRVVEHGETFAQAAAWANVSKSTVWEWVRRWRAATPGGPCVVGVPGRALQPPASLARRGCRARRRRGSASCVSGPGWSPRRLADEPEIARSHSTVHRVLQRGGCSRRPRARAPGGHPLPVAVPGPAAAHGRQEARRFSEPGHKMTGDRTRRSRRVGWEYVHSIVDDCSRLAYSEIHDDERAADRHRVHRARAGLLPRARRSSASG